MKNRCKFIILILVLMVTVSYAPVHVVNASTDTYGLYDFDVYGLNNDSDEFTLEDIWIFLKELPDAIVSFFSGFYSLVVLLRNLILVVFPFFPPVFVDILILLLLLYFIIALYRLIQGWFG